MSVPLNFSLKSAAGICLWGRRVHSSFVSWLLNCFLSHWLLLLACACCDFPFIFLITLFSPYFSEHYLFTLFHFASPLSYLPVWFPITSSSPWSFILSSSDSLCCLSVSALAPRHLHFPPLHHLTPFIPSLCLSSLYFPPVFSSSSLFSVSVEPLWLHRYSDCWLCRGGGMLLRHSIRRYCTPVHAAWHNRHHCFEHLCCITLYWGPWGPAEMCCEMCECVSEWCVVLKWWPVQGVFPVMWLSRLHKPQLMHH